MPDDIAPGCVCVCVCADSSCTHNDLPHLLPGGRCPLLADWWTPLLRHEDPVTMCRGCASQASERGDADPSRAGEVEMINKIHLDIEPPSC